MQELQKKKIQYWIFSGFKKLKL